MSYLYQIFVGKMIVGKMIVGKKYLSAKRRRQSDCRQNDCRQSDCDPSERFRRQFIYVLFEIYLNGCRRQRIITNQVVPN